MTKGWWKIVEEKSDGKHILALNNGEVKGLATHPRFPQFIHVHTILSENVSGTHSHTHTYIYIHIQIGIGYR